MVAHPSPATSSRNEKPCAWPGAVRIRRWMTKQQGPWKVWRKEMSSTSAWRPSTSKATVISWRCLALWWSRVPLVSAGHWDMCLFYKRWQIFESWRNPWGTLGSVFVLWTLTDFGILNKPMGDMCMSQVAPFKITGRSEAEWIVDSEEGLGGKNHLDVDRISTVFFSVLAGNLFYSTVLNDAENGCVQAVLILLVVVLLLLGGWGEGALSFMTVAV